MAQLKKAMNFFQNTLPIAEAIGDEVGRRMLCSIMEISHWRKGEFSRAIEWFEGALRACPSDETEHKRAQIFVPLKYEGLQVVMERGIAILTKRIKIARNQHDSLRILLASFSMIPLMLFTRRGEKIPYLLEEIVPLAKKFKKKEILDTIPALQKFMGND